MALTIIRDRVFKPNWRSPENTLINGEMDSLTRTESSNKNNIDNVVCDLSEYLASWQSNRNIVYAGELVSAAITNGHTEHDSIREAAQFILGSNEVSERDSLYFLAKSVISQNSGKKKINDLQEENTATLPTLKDYNTNLHKKVNQARAKVRLAPFNAFRHIELSRAYMLNGQHEKAAKSAFIATHLAPSNRYVTRSAVRCFLHNRDLDKAKYVISKNESLKTDPWLLATDISVDIIRRKTPRNVKLAFGIVRDDKYHPRALTEIAIALAILENNANGSIKKIRNLVKRAMEAPIDNSLAQARHLSYFNPAIMLPEQDISKIKFNYELETYSGIDNNEYESAFRNSLLWFHDSGFSHRAAVTASNLAATFLNDIQTSIDLLQLALVTNPGSPILLNNLAYQLLDAGKVKEAQRALAKVDYSVDMPKATRVCLKATNGMLQYKLGNASEGERLYREAQEMAKSHKDLRHGDLAHINMLKEQALSGEIEKEIAVAHLNGYNTNDKLVDKQKSNVIKLLTEHRDR